MSGGTIEQGAKVAGVIIDADTVNILPQQINDQNTPCNIKRTGSSNFVGRAEKLEELHKLLYCGRVKTELTGLLIQCYDSNCTRLSPL